MSRLRGLPLRGTFGQPRSIKRLLDDWGWCADSGDKAMRQFVIDLMPEEGGQALALLHKIREESNGTWRRFFNGEEILALAPEVDALPTDLLEEVARLCFLLWRAGAEAGLGAQGACRLPQHYDPLAGRVKAPFRTWARRMLATVYGDRVLEESDDANEAGAISG